MSMLTAVRRSTVAKTRSVEIPADHPFAAATVAAGALGKGSTNDRRRYQARALRIASKGQP